ncbi:Cyclopropane-fatty-acyl-phospholipid synthase [Pseudoruegeria aquimaris]|uniref:Cyclopropane-fatty-acyl-phospholipid synthase n=1 Tax=Pseudoruegeria aquimaris TaxID=393663 RepID=A0A1Y5SQQ6_9RHOB|nr:cyclopropane-fatty-acyl-phospholipid synthase family protein [Pseudoruegeria aquimaris]SLN43145.1 Cyclopropane-fatty-acyl-phospholipid synthase [Pseudoruegeria aquimaris]
MWVRLLDSFITGVARHGTFVVHFPDGEVHTYGDGTGTPVTIRLLDDSLPRRIVMNPDLAVGEGYMDGTLTIDGDDLHGFLTFVIRNLATRPRVWFQQPSRFLRTALRGIRQYNPVGRAKHNVAHHYDLSGALYDLFLDADKQYSCAYFRSPDDTLEEAQANKKAHIAGKLLLEPGMKVLDIGCGWGGMGLTLAKDYGAQVLGVTLSEEQHKVACERARAAGLEGRVEFRLADYRSLTGQFDRIVSVGMFEHVGTPHYREYFRHLRNRLTDDGVALIHTIGRTAPPGATSPWIDKYIFPGGYIPSMSEVLKAIEKEDLCPTDVEVWRLHYAETLKHWHERFRAREDEARALYDARFCRMWRYYLLASEMTFRYNRQVVFQFQLARHQEAVPLTRDYLYRESPAPAAAASAAE